MSLCLLIHYSVIIYAWFKMNQNSDLQCIQHYYRNIITKYLRFISIYSVIWIVPNVGKFMEIYYGINNLPFWLVLSVHIGFASSGIGNGIVWLWNSETFDDSKIPYVRLDDDTPIWGSTLITVHDYTATTT